MYPVQAQKPMKQWAIENPVVQTQVETPPDRNVLLVSPWPEDQESLKAILKGWTVKTVDSCLEALAFLETDSCSIVLTERDLPDGDWKEVLQAAGLRRNPRPVVVISQLADDLLWGEVLNCGAYDLLAKPLDRKAVTWVMDSAWLHQKYKPDTIAEL